jgi:hypothetical protein
LLPTFGTVTAGTLASPEDHRHLYEEHQRPEVSHPDVPAPSGVDSRGAARDTIDCGPGRRDVAIVDPLDNTSRCEQVRLP